ncbi:DUF3737 family protein [Enterococcus timonensis]|uniref:DUF3737 family protein n=1 Tax=Enterococcus timonensis TaxID=1852364 RepID=UPI0008DA9BF3|nr:DUF3737 family protein [Enterococcus timonensis]
MQEINQEVLTGERALFKIHDAKIFDSVFQDGESPLKESRNLTLENDIFRWKYPLWYSENITGENLTMTETARSGIWYTKNITIKNSLLQAPKIFRRAEKIHLENVQLTNAQETLWNCSEITLNHVTAVGDYFGMNSKKIKIADFNLSGNYAFDGARDLEIKNAHLNTKDAFWNCQRVVVRDSIIVGEYLGWNSEDITFINCTIESNQGLCYMKNVTLINCQLLHTDLAFEYSTVDAQITTEILSVKNPISGTISAQGIGEIIFDDPTIEKNATKIICQEEISDVI